MVLVTGCLRLELAIPSSLQVYISFSDSSDAMPVKRLSTSFLLRPKRVTRVLLVTFAFFASIAENRLSRATQMYDDEVELELAEKQAEQESSFQSAFIPGSRGQAQGVTPPEPSRPSPFAGTFGIDFRSQYFSYGLVIQDEGVTTQSYLNLRYSFLQDTSPSSFLNNVTAYITSWSDFSSNVQLSSPASAFRNFTESDLIAGVSFTFLQRYNANLSLTTFVSPAGAYGAGAFARAIFLYDDSNTIAKNFNLKPQFVVVYSLPSSGHIGLNDDSFLFEPGVTPNYTFRHATPSPVNVALPMRLGLGNDFFDGSTYGYFSVGPQFTVRLPFWSSDFINTNLNLGYTYVNLGPTTADFASNNNKNQHLFNLGLSINF